MPIQGKLQVFSKSGTCKKEAAIRFALTAASKEHEEFVQNSTERTFHQLQRGDQSWNLAVPAEPVTCRVAERRKCKKLQMSDAESGQPKTRKPIQLRKVIGKR